jgi:hypothetical protein
VPAATRLDEQILEENHRPAPAGDDALAACRHADHAGIIFGDKGREGGIGTETVAQPIGFAGAHRVQGILGLRQQPLQSHQRRDVLRLCRAYAKRDGARVF